jgi:predicted DNA-binding transcriptional regulator AlpA
VIFLGVKFGSRATERRTTFLGSILCLTILNRSVQYNMSERSISEVAREIVVQRATLYEWIRKRKIPTPRLRMVSGVRLRVWTDREVEEIKKYKAEYYRKKPSLRRKKKGKKHS